MLRLLTFMTLIGIFLLRMNVEAENPLQTPGFCSNLMMAVQGKVVA